MKKIYIGIDISKLELVVAYLNESEKWVRIRYENSVSGIQSLLAHFEGMLIHVILEPTGTYSQHLVYLLAEQGIDQSHVNPYRASKFREAIGEAAKTDDRDARTLCRYGHQMQPAAHAPKGEKQETYRQLISRLNSLKKRHTQLLNQLEALNQEYFVQPLVKQSCIEELDWVDQTIVRIEQELKSLSTDEFEEVTKQIQTVVGIGAKTAPQLALVTAGLTTFDSAKGLVRFFGVCPNPYESGTSVKGKGKTHRSSMPSITSMLYMCARSAKRYNHSCRLLYERLRRKGKCHKVAMVAVIHKLLKQVFAVVKSGKPFDNDYYLKWENNSN